LSDPLHARLVRTLWDKDRDYYDKCRRYVEEAAEAGGEYAWLRERLPARGTVLEVGCGEGINLEVLARPGLRFVGCDVARLPLRLALERAPSDRSRVFLQADAERLPFRPRSFDAVLAISVLEHLVEPERALGSMIEALRPGGSLLLVSPQYGGPLGASPGRRGGGPLRFASRMLRTLPRARPRRLLGWERVYPPVLDGASFEGDLDALVEPDLRSLRGFLVGRGLEIVATDSGLDWYSWTTHRSSALVRGLRAACERAGRRGLPVFRDLGPLVALHARRKASA
jgi:SAM-dependent methyltransferase